MIEEKSDCLKRVKCDVNTDNFTLVLIESFTKDRIDYRLASVWPNMCWFYTKNISSTYRVSKRFKIKYVRVVIKGKALYGIEQLCIFTFLVIYQYI